MRIELILLRREDGTGNRSERVNTGYFTGTNESLNALRAWLSKIAVSLLCVQLSELEV